MRLLLDENASDGRFIKLLRDGCHDVETSISALGAGASDASILTYAIANERVIVTRDCADLRELAASVPEHPGLLLIFASSVDPSERLCAAIGRIESLYATTNRMILSVADFTW